MRALVGGDLGVEFGHAGGEFGDDFGMLGGEVVFLAEVGFEVEEKDLRFCVLVSATAFFDEEFIVSRADSIEVAVGGVVKEFVARALVGTGEEFGDVEAVDFFVGGEFGTSEGGDGGEEINGAAKRFAGGVGGDAPGSPHHAGDTLATFKSGAFTIAEGTGRAAVVFEGEPGAVVSGENEVGVLIELKFAEEVGDASDLGIDVFDDVGVGVERIGVADFIGNVEGDVGHGVGEVEEEGLLFVSLDELEGFVGVATSDGPLIDGDFDDFLILHERSLPFGEGGFGFFPECIHAVGAALGFVLVGGMIHIVGVWDAEVGTESVAGGEGFGVVAEVPFSEAGGGVSLAFEMVGDGVFGGIEAVF